MPINPGEAFVAGIDATTATNLLAAAKRAGLPPSVVRVDPTGGFIVPAALVHGEALPKRPRKTKKTTTSSTSTETNEEG